VKKRCSLALLLFLSLSTHVPLWDLTIYITEGNLFDNCFKEPFETVFIIMEDGKIYGFSAHLENTVGIGATFIRDFLKRKGYEISQISIIVHNHSHMPKLSYSDITVYRELVRMGFKGSYGIYHEPSRKVMLYKEKEARQ